MKSTEKWLAWHEEANLGFCKKLFQIINKASDYTVAMQFRVKGLVQSQLHMLMERNGTMKQMPAKRQRIFSKQQLYSRGWKTRQQVVEQKRRQCPLWFCVCVYVWEGRNSECIYFSPVSDACFLKHHFSTPSCGLGLTLYHDWQWEKKERKKDIFRLEGAEGLPKIWGWGIPILKSDLWIGGSARIHLFCGFFFILIRLFLGCKEDSDCCYWTFFWNTVPI